MMKKFALFVIVATLACALFATPVSAESQDANGTVKVDLVEFGTGPNWNVVGSLNLNTSISGKLVIDVNMNTVPNLENYDVIVNIYYSPVPPLPPTSNLSKRFPDVLETNAQGQGHTRVELNIAPPPTNDSVWVIVSVGEEPPKPVEYFNVPPPVKVPWKGNPSNGAVKVDAVEFGTEPNWNVVGSLIFNTTSSGKLIVDVNMDTEKNLQDYDVIINVFYSPPSVPPAPNVSAVFPDVLNTNSQGQGNAHVEVDISPPSTNDYIWVSVFMRQAPTTPPTPSPYSNIPPQVKVPLK